MSAGRKPLIDLSNPDLAGQFRKCVTDWKAGKLPIEVIAEQFNVNPKTIRRVAAELATRDTAEKTYSAVTNWGQMPRALEYEKWVCSQVKPLGAAITISSAKRVWHEVWNNKNLSLLEESDIINAVSWIKNLSLSKSAKFGYKIAVRSLIHFGFGDHAWLKKHLSTKGQKGDPRIPPELRSEETFPTVMPRIFHALDKLNADGTIDAGEYIACKMIYKLKSTTQARTGNANDGREVWGTRINNPTTGKSSMIVTQEGRLVHWTVFAKKGETWEIDREDLETYPGLVEEIESYIKTLGLKTGDLLIPKHFTTNRANKILKQCCQLAELSPYNLHDFRKVGFTTLIKNKVPLEVAITMFVGWLDAGTAVKYYQTIKGLGAKEGYAMMKTALRQTEL